MAPGARTTAIVYPAVSPSGATLILGHGAGAGQYSAWMVDMASALADRGLDVVTFNFLYTERGRKPPDRTPVLEATWRAVIDAVSRDARLGAQALVIGGKSMGGRMATHIAAAGDPRVRGVVLFGYPLHPPGQPGKMRDAHLPAVTVPVLFVQGSKDTFGGPDELEPVIRRMTASVTLRAVEGGDHSLVVTRKAAVQAQVMDGVRDAVAAWVGTVTRA